MRGITVWSRRSTNTRPPWSRRRAAQPASVTRRPASSARGSPQPRSRHGIGDLLVRERAVLLAPPPQDHAVGAGEEHHARTEPFALCELPLRRPAGVVRVAADPAATKLAHQRKCTRTVPFAEAHEHVDPRLRLLEVEREEQPLDPGPEADPGRGRPADLLDEVVVAAAAADRALRADRLVHELECRARVVVEPAHERRCELVADAVGVEVAAYGVEVLAAGVAERLADLWRVGERRLHPRVLDVEDTERRRRALLARLGVEDVLVLVEPRVQALDVGGPALAVADRVELEPVV